MSLNNGVTPNAISSTNFIRYGIAVLKCDGTSEVLTLMWADRADAETYCDRCRHWFQGVICVVTEMRGEIPTLQHTELGKRDSLFVTGGAR